MTAVNGIVESCLYVHDLSRSAEFYEKVLGLRELYSDPRGRAFRVADRQVLLLFLKGASTEGAAVHGGAIPGHDGSGRLHIGFSISASDLAKWEQRLRDCSVEIESRVTWPEGGTSLYFRDPDGHLVELLTPGVWPIY